MKYNPYASRKLLVTAFSTILMILLPVVYKNIGISDHITLMVLGSVAGLSGIYNAANAAQKKFEEPPRGL
jgi:hypothetical protein